MESKNWSEEELAVVRRGLWGFPPQSNAEIAERVGRTETAVEQVIQRRFGGIHAFYGNGMSRSRVSHALGVCPLSVSDLFDQNFLSGVVRNNQHAKTYCISRKSVLQFADRYGHACDAAKSNDPEVAERIRRCIQLSPHLTPKQVAIEYNIPVHIVRRRMNQGLLEWHMILNNTYIPRIALTKSPPRTWHHHDHCIRGLDLSTLIEPLPVLQWLFTADLSQYWTMPLRQTKRIAQWLADHRYLQRRVDQYEAYLRSVASPLKPAG